MAHKTLTDRRRETLERLRQHARRLEPLSHIRPSILATPLYKLLSPSAVRGIVHVDDIGLLYLDPVSHLGRTILTDGVYEPETVSLLHEYIKPGHTVFDIGANEGVMSVCAANLVGPSGRVVAIEPQSRLLDVLEINLSLNATGRYDLIHGAVSDLNGQVVAISLHPAGNTGASSIVRPYRWSSKKEDVPTVTITQVATSLGIDRIDFVKVDVEGYEPEVVKSLRPLLADNRVGNLLIDYHVSILSKRGIDAHVIHDSILDSGYKAVKGTPAGGYVLYGT